MINLGLFCSRLSIAKFYKEKWSIFTESLEPLNLKQRNVSEATHSTMTFSQVALKLFSVSHGHTSRPGDTPPDAGKKCSLTVRLELIGE